jgi:triosephosphate isomerase
MPTQWLIGNWKMNGGMDSNAALLDEIRKVSGFAKMAVAVPYPYLSQARDVLQDSDVQLSAQNLSEFDKGAYTGEVSAMMLCEFGVTLTLVGHSERRHLFGETDDVVAAKAMAALGAGLTPVVCVGETLSEREAGAAKEVVLRQLNTVIECIGAGSLSRCILAYEPVWAIGTGKTASPEQAQEVHGWLREVAVHSGAADVSILYGGSVKASNAAELFAQPDVNGGLVGGASLEAKEFSAIYQALSV